MTVALCPGSFDPPTNGHLDVIERCAAVFDRLVVAVVANPSKTPLFTAGERVELLRAVAADLGNVEVESFEGLLVDFAEAQGVDVLVKGLRAVPDFDYELQMAQMNHTLRDGDTLVIPTAPEWSVPEVVMTALKERLS